MKFTFTPGKFVYRENAIVDLGSVSELVFGLTECLLRREADVGTCRSFELLIELIHKICKTTLVNFLSYIEHYRHN